MADFNLTQTGEQVQTILDNAPTATDVNTVAADLTAEITRAQTAEQANAGAISAEVTRAQNAEQANAGAISAEETRAKAAEQTNAGAISAEETRAKAAEQTNADAISAEETRAKAAEQTNSSAIGAETAAREAAVALLQQAVTNITNALVNYYLKSETYNKSEVDSLISTVMRFRYEVASELPTASADTVGIVYLIPSTNPKTKNVKDEFITITSTSGSSTTYGWEQIGSTTVDLSNYYTISQTDAAITAALNTALASYYTKAQVDAIRTALENAVSAEKTRAEGVEGELQTAIGNEVTRAEGAEQSLANAISAEVTRAQNAESALDVRTLFMERSFGKYSNTGTQVLSRAEDGKYVNVGGTTTAASGYGISNSFSLNAGDILLVPSAQAVPADVSVVARIVTRTFDKVIGYAYTYREDYPTLPLTATADYDASLVYTAVYDETGETPTLTGWTRGGTSYSTLPATREVTESYYEPLVKQSVSAMPSTGYYIYLCPTAMTVVISGLTATVNGGTCMIVGWGIFKNICSNFVGAPGQSVIAQAFAQQQAAIDGLKKQLQNLGYTKAECIDFKYLPKVCGESMVVEGEGAPSVVPMFVGQRYHDTTNRKVYEAFAVTNSTSDWVLLN